MTVTTTLGFAALGFAALTAIVALRASLKAVKVKAQSRR